MLFNNYRSVSLLCTLSKVFEKVMYSRLHSFLQEQNILIVSSTKTITCGVPQGSILGPLLFLIYINDLYNVCLESVPILFADDTNLFYSGSHIETLVRSINDELSNISTWLKTNKLSLNVKKTHYMIFHRKKAVMPNLKIQIDNQDIDQVYKTKFLGVVIVVILGYRPSMSNGTTRGNSLMEEVRET